VPHGSVPDSELIEKNGRTYYAFAGPLRDIKEDIQYHKHRCWGLVVYRCDYTSDEVWEKFMSNMRYKIEAGLTANKAEDLKDTLELTVREDKENLDGANFEQVRGSFKDWVQSDEAKSEMGQGAPCGAFKSPRYTYCVHADVDVIDSVVNRAPQPPEYDRRQIGYVNLVQLVEEDFNPEMVNTEDDDEDGEDDEQLEGDENHVKVPLNYLGPESYNKLYNPYTFKRYVTYRRDDDVS
jgi:hypothetical protein